MSSQRSNSSSVYTKKNYDAQVDGGEQESDEVRRADEPKPNPAPVDQPNRKVLISRLESSLVTVGRS